MTRRHRTRALHLVLALALSLHGTPASAAPAANTRARAVKPVRSAAQFITPAAGRSLFGMELGELALQRSKTASIRRLARRLVDEHARTYEVLLQLASQAGVTTVPESLDLEQRGIKARLAVLTGAEFDRAYVDALRTNDARDIALYRTYAHGGTDATLKAWAAERLPLIRKRQQLLP